MKLNRILLCSALALAIALPVQGEEAVLPEVTAAPTQAPTPAPTQAPVVTAEVTAAPTAEPTVEVTTAPTAEPTVETTSAPTAEITAEPTAEVTTEPTAEVTTEPTAEITAEPTAEVTPESTSPASPEATVTPEASVTPNPSASLEPSVSPEASVTPEASVSPEPSVTPEATAVPKPDEIGEILTITPEGSAVQENDAWNITISAQDAALAFTWTLAEGNEALAYLVYIEDASGQLTLLQSGGSEARIQLSAASYPQGTLYVGAELTDGSLTWGKVAFATTSDTPMNPGTAGGMGSFGGSSSRPSGSASAAMGGGEVDLGFRVTPGQAITSKHSSGTMNDRAYTDAAVETLDEAVTALSLGVTQAQITLDAGANAFLAVREEEKLSLYPAESGQAWSLSVLAMQALSDSGVDRVSFHLDGMVISLSTQMELSGSVYAQLRTQGYVAKDVQLEISDQGVIASIAENNYRIDEGGVLAPLEG